MAVSYTIEGRILTLTTVGKSSVEEIVDAVNSALADPRFNEASVVIWDTRQSASLGDRSTEELRRIGEGTYSLVDKFPNYSAVIANNDLYYGLMRMVVTFTEKTDPRTQFFRSEEEAMAWVQQILAQTDTDTDIGNSGNSAEN